MKRTRTQQAAAVHPWRAKFLAAVVGLILAAAPVGADPGAAISLARLATRHGFVAYAARGRTLTLSTRFSTFEFEGDTRKLTYNRVLIWLNAPIARRWPGSWMIQDCDLEHTLYPLLNPPRCLRSRSARVILLDPGHGGDDPGAANDRLRLIEKDLTLDLAKRVQTILAGYGVNVRLTRTGDQSRSLEERCLLAQRWNADLLVSIHLNAAASRDSHGIETHIVPPAGCPITTDTIAGRRDRVVFPGNRYDGANLLLGYTLQKHLLKHTRAEERGVRRSRFYVIRNAPCPAALVECGFLSHPGEAARLGSRPYRDALVKGLAEGLLDYANAVRRAQASAPPPVSAPPPRR